MSKMETAAGVALPTAANHQSNKPGSSYPNGHADVHTKLSDLIAKLEGVKKQGAGYQARCPAHDDHRASLSLTERSGKILVHCHAGCAAGDVLGAVGWEMSDLFEKPVRANGQARTPGNLGPIVTSYDYRDERGELLYQVTRHDPKDFRQRKPDGTGGWKWSLGDVRRVLYRLPELIGADPDATVFIVEGEKDADALARAGLVATCNVGGAGKWRAEYGDCLKGRDVVILPDNDQPGRNHADQVARALKGRARSVKVIDLPGLPDKGDVSDWMAAGGDAEALCVLAENAPEWREAPIIEKPAGPPAIVTHNEVLRRILAGLEPLEYSEFEHHAVEKYGFTEGDVLRQKHWVVLAVDLLLTAITEHGYHLARSGDFIFVYNGAYWRECDREAFSNFLGQAAAKLGVKAIEVAHHRYRGELYSQFLASAYFEEIEQREDTVLINLQNGTFEIDRQGQRLREFRAGDFLKHQLSFAFDSAARAPIFDRYLSRVLPEIELQHIIAEYFGYVFTRGMKLEKALLLYGSGANGKSVLFDVMNALLGRQNISNFSLSDLNEEHNRAHIANKLLNYGSEINAGITKDIFKTLVSGEPIMARLKYGNSFQMERYAKLAFNCNELPKDIEHSEAYFRRLLIVPFKARIPDDEQDKDLARKIVETELAGVFNWVLAGLRRLLVNRNFTASDIVRKQVEEYRRESDSVQSFIDENPGRELGLLKVGYANYREHCNEAGHKALGRNNFAKRLRALGYAVEKHSEFGVEVKRT